jgi:hypothetical protein
MSKKKNYYYVHKNKKPNKKLPKGLDPKVIECLTLAFEVVNKAIRRSQMLAYLSQPIPKYKRGSDDLATVGGIITDSDRTEYFVTIKGEKIRVKEPNNFNRIENHINKYESINEFIKGRVGSVAITADELLKSHEDFIEKMNKISNSNNSFLNNKAPN